jgi:hypothetical protein
MDIGRKETCALLQRYKWCLARNEWPGVSEKIDVMDPPDWVEQKFGSAGEITLAGATAFSEE